MWFYLLQVTQLVSDRNRVCSQVACVVAWSSIWALRIYVGRENGSLRVRGLGRKWLSDVNYRVSRKTKQLWGH